MINRIVNVNDPYTICSICNCKVRFSKTSINWQNKRVCNRDLDPYPSIYLTRPTRGDELRPLYKTKDRPNREARPYTFDTDHSDL